MARIKQLEFPINKIKNPNLAGPEIPDVQNVPLSMPGELRKTTQAQQTLTPVAPAIPTATAKTTAAAQQVTPVVKPFGVLAGIGGPGGFGDKLTSSLERTQSPLQIALNLVKKDPQTAQQKVTKPVIEAPVAQPIPTEAVREKPIPTEAGKAPAVSVVENVEVAKAQTDLDQLSTFARDALLAPDDPISVAKFNNALTNIGLVNQASMDLLQFQINANPDLAGQPAGTALLTMLARQQGSDVSNLITNLSIESADRVRDLNRWGFNALSGIVSFREAQKENVRRELLAAGDFDAYASAFQRDTGMKINVQDLKELSPATAQTVLFQNNLLDQALKAGDIDAARRHFDNIVAIAPNTYNGADFDSLGFADQSYLLKGAEDEKVSAQIRLDIAQGELGNAITGIEAQFSEPERIEGGTSLLTDKTLEEINAALESAGLDPVADKTELLGREDDVFAAFKVQELASGLDQTIVDVGVDSFVDELSKLEPGLKLDDEALKEIRGFVLSLNTGGFITTDANGNVQIDPNELVEPWDEDSDSVHLYTSWPVMDADGTVIQDSEFYTESNPRPMPDSELGKLMDSLDKDWESYLLNTPKDGRLNRQQWFFATSGGTAEVDPEKVPEGIGRDEGGPLDDLDESAILADIGVLNDTEFNNKFENDKTFRDEVISVSTSFSSVGSLEGLTANSIQKDIINGPTQGYAKIGDSIVRFSDVQHTSSGGDLVSFVTTGETLKIFTSVAIDIIDPATGEVISTQRMGLPGSESAGKVTQEGGEPITIEEFLARQKGEGTESTGITGFLGGATGTIIS